MKNNRNKIYRLRIPLETLTEEEQKDLKHQMGKNIIIINKEPCLTCGRKKFLQRIQRTDGKREIIQECLYCLTSRFHTKANREV